MKKLAQGFMLVVILIGFILALTPIIGSIMTSGDDRTVIRGKDDAVKTALSEWFKAPKSAFVDVHAIRQIKDNKPISRLSFSTTPEVVRGFLANKSFKQQDLTATIMADIFTDKTLSWWSPEALQRKTWFMAKDQNKTLHLIYNDKTQRAVLVVQ